eukprot:3972259-Prymnesium_polylepis.1
MAAAIRRYMPHVAEANAQYMPHHFLFRPTVTLQVNGINCGGCAKSLKGAFTAADIEVVSVATKTESGGHPNTVVVKADNLDAVKEAIAAADKGRGKFTIEEAAVEEAVATGAHEHEHGHGGGDGCCGGHGHEHGH